MKLRVPSKSSKPTSAATAFAPRGLPISGDPPPDETVLAPPPQIDRYPVVIGPGLSLAYVSNIFRLSTTGFRQQYVDLLDELLEKDPHAYSIVSKRANSVGGGRVELEAPVFPEGSNDATKAEEIRAYCQQQIENVPDLAQNLISLAWGIFWSLAGLENHWRRDGSDWVLDRFSFIHSRRLSYPRPMSWDLHVWDQGAVSSSIFGGGETSPLPLGPYRGAGTPQDWPTGGLFGLRVADFPGKFTIHAPQVRGGYPTREGVGREIAYWMVLKLVASRKAPSYLERFATPWPEATFKTSMDLSADGKGMDVARNATKEDIAEAKAAMKVMGAGGLASYVHPDSIKIDLRTPDSGATGKLTFGEWISICDAQMSKAVLGGTLSTEVGSTGGNRALGETQKKGETVLFKQDGRMLGETLRRDVFRWMVFLNFGEDAARKYTPHVRVYVEDDPDPMLVVQRAKEAVGIGLPVDGKWLGEEAGLTLVKKDDPNAIRLFPIMASKTPESFDRDLAQRENEINEEFGPTPEEQAAQAAAAAGLAGGAPTPKSGAKPPPGAKDKGGAKAPPKKNETKKPAKGDEE